MENFKEEIQSMLLGMGEKVTYKEAIHGIHEQMEVPDIRVKGAIDKLFDVLLILDSEYDLLCFGLPGKIDEEIIFKIIVCTEYYCGEGYKISEVRYSIEEALELNVEEEAHMLAFLNE